MSSHSVSVDVDVKAQIVQHLDVTTQEDTGHDIDVLIQDIAKTKFQNLALERKSDKLDKKNIQQIKFGFSITAIALAVVAVIGAIATIIFSTGVFTAGATTLAVVTGFVGISTSFNQLDKAIYRYINYHKEEKIEKTRINKLLKKINNVKTLITGRVNALEHITDKETRNTRCAEILAQIIKVNGFVKAIKEQVPSKINAFTVFDTSPLLKYV